jgi:hypothetical protein
MDLAFLLELFGLFLTISVLLYLFIGDNALFRLVTYLFIGVVAGYLAVLILFNVLLPRLATMLLSGNLLLTVVGGILILMGVLLLFKLIPRLSRFGSLPMAILVGVGAAVAIGGAVFGTLFGQIGGTLALFNVREGGNLLSGVYVLLGAICTLAYFQFSTRTRAATPVVEGEVTAPRATLLEWLAKIGQVFIGITLGAIFAGVYTAAISAMVERLGFIYETVFNILKITKIF